MTNVSEINPLGTKMYLSDLKTHFAKRSKRFLLRFKKPVS